MKTHANHGKLDFVWTRYFTRLCIIISSICVIFLVNLDDFFSIVGYAPIAVNWSIWRSGVFVSRFTCPVIYMSYTVFHQREHIWWKPQFSWKLVQTTAKKLSKFSEKITHVDDMIIHNFVKYLVQTRLYLWDINNKFLTNHLDDLDTFLAWNLLFLYLTNKVEFGQDILQGCVSSYHLHVWFLWWI